MGALSANQYVLGSTAADVNSRFIYRQSTGALFYDADGLGGTAQIQIATLSNRFALSASDFIIV